MNRRLLSRNGWDIEMSGILKTPEKGVNNGPRLSIKESAAPDLTNRGCIQFTVEEIEEATNGFGDENLIGSGDHGIVYRGILCDTTRVAVKKLLVMNW